MSQDARRKALWNAIEKMRQAGRRLEPLELAQLGITAGLTPSEIMEEIQDYQDPRIYPRLYNVDIAVRFIGVACERSKSKEILEYSTRAHFLSLDLLNSRKRREVTYVCPVPNISDVLRTILIDGATKVYRAIAALPAGAVYDAIICQPPIGSAAGGERRDHFGGEVVSQLASLLTKDGTLYWVTGRGVLFTPRAKETLTHLAEGGLFQHAAIELPEEAFPGTSMKGAVVVLRREPAEKRLVGTLRDVETAEQLSAVVAGGAKRNDGPSWTWLSRDDHRTFGDLERERFLRKLTPHGRHNRVSLGSLVMPGRVMKADRPVAEDDKAAAFLFVPEYAGSRVTARLEEQSVRANAVYRLAVDPTKANAHFLAHVLNSPYGKEIRASAAQVPSRHVLELADASSGCMRLSDHAARSMI
jgi:hypothetical protein